MKYEIMLVLVGIIYMAPHLPKYMGLGVSALFIVASAAVELGWMK